MRSFLILLLHISALSGWAQPATTPTKALNTYAVYGNEAGEEVQLVVETAFKHYQALTGKYPDRQKYVCPFQMDPYFLNAVQSVPKALTITPAVVSAFAELRKAVDDVDAHCKKLDTYYKLEDYKRDNYQEARRLLESLQPLVTTFRKNHSALQKALEAAFRAQQTNAISAYATTDQRLLRIVEVERNYLETWRLNFNEPIYSGWNADLLQKSIAESVSMMNDLKAYKPALKYPASSMWEHFKEIYAEFIEVKRRTLDEHTYEASKSDKHNNDAYLNLINYFNGTLVSDYNTFLEFSQRDGYYGLQTLRLVPAFEIIRTKQTVTVEVKPFEDIAFDPIQVSKQKAPISAAVFDALSEYIAYINETGHQTRGLQSTIQHFNGTANFYYGFETFEKRQPMQFDFSKFQVPLSAYQKLISASKALPANLSKSLNTQAQVLLNVLNEMNAVGAAIDQEVTERRYEKDRLKRIYDLLEREKTLVNVWDERKEKLYANVRTIYDSYPPASPSSSWEKSGTALRRLVDLDHDALFEARKFYSGDSTVKINTEPIESTLREVISKEYENMKGIEKLGRYNGNCPYSPYEDVPKNSRSLAEYFSKLEKRNANHTRYSDPYHSMVYLYNQIVDDYNQFCELSKVPHLKTVKQLEDFDIVYPKPKEPRISKEAVQTKAGSIEQPTSLPKSNNDSNLAEKPSQGNIASRESRHTRDTVYIEKRDTIYIREPNEELRSMEGYATNNMVLLLDISGSMNQPDKLPLLKDAMLAMLQMMREEDQVSIIGFSGKPKVLLKPTSFKDEGKIRKAVSDLTSSGKTDGRAAIRLAYKIADENYIRGGNNRIILATDGEFAMDEETQKLIESFAKQDIFLTVFNFGKGMGSSKTLQNLANLGKGNYEAISRENVELKLIREAKSKRKK